jgi:hypothetical protein
MTSVGVALMTEVISLGATVDLERVWLKGFEPSSRLGVSAESEWRIANRFFTATRIDGLRVRGAPRPGVDMTISAGMRDVTGTTVVAGILLDRRGEVGPFTRIELPIARPLRIGGGYDALSDQFGTMVSVDVGPVRVTTQVMLHSVLGRSHGVVITWYA